MKAKLHLSSYAISCEECGMPSKRRYKVEEGMICEDCAKTLHPYLFWVVEKKPKQKESLFDD
jgi:NAD-dependent SIR2 family protein deacetylase